MANPQAADAGIFTVTRLLNELPVRLERNGGYDRSNFAGWLDRNRDGCDTRAEVLIQESRRRVTKTASCTVISGLWFSTYDGRTIDRARQIHIDHVVALAEAWGSGARRWNQDTRNRFANDLTFRGSLRAVSASSNLTKSDQDPAEWLPPRAPARCGFIRDWVAIKWRWGLSVNVAERRAIRNMLEGCPRMIVRVTKAKVALPPPPPPPPPPACSQAYPGVCIPPPPPDLDCGDVPFENFTVLSPDPHNFDGDADGLGCES